MYVKFYSEFLNTLQTVKHVEEELSENHKMKAIIDLGTKLIAPFRPLVKKCTLGDDQELDEGRSFIISFSQKAFNTPQVYKKKI